MAAGSAIEWTDTTWNPSTGCSKVSSGCKYCYAETMASRLKKMGCARYSNEFRFTMHWDKIEEPLSWKKPRKVFVNSMSDLFHEDVNLDFVRRVFDVMRRAEQHRFQVLTKRPARMAQMLTELKSSGHYQATPNIWLGTSIESDQVRERADSLRNVPAIVRFLSCEPLLGPLEHVDFANMDWVIVGGESGQHLWEERARKRRGLVEYLDGQWVPREERISWIEGIRSRCNELGIAFFFKQWGGATPKAAGRQLSGETWEQYPGDREHRAVAARN